MLPVKGLPAIFLLLQVTWADELKAPLNELNKYSPFEDVNYFQRIRADNKEDYENFYLLSTNYPTKLSFRASTTPNYKYDAFIERLSFNADTRKTCSFPAFGYDPATYYIRLQSSDTGYEVFQIVKTYDDISKNSIEFFIINMTDCQYSRSEILKGYDYFKYGGSFLVFHPWNRNCFDFFSFNGKDDCGSYICKRVYNYGKQAFEKPTAFILPDYTPSTKLVYLAPAYEEGYYSILKSEDKCSLLSLTPSGSLINTINNEYNRKFKLLSMATNYDVFSICYILDSREKEATCLQFDSKLNNKFNRTIEFGYETRYLAAYNLQEGGLLLLSSYCASRDYENCPNQEFRLTKFDATGTYGEYSKFNDEACTPTKRRFTFYEEDGRVCIFYACDSKREKDNKYEYTVRSRCF